MVLLIVALCLYSVHSIRGNLVINQVAPFPPTDYMYQHLYFSSSQFSAYIRIYTHSEALPAFFKPPNSRFLNLKYTDQTLSIYWPETRFETPSLRALLTYKSFNDPLRFFERVFEAFSNSRTDFYVILVSKICEADPIILRISRGTTYLNFIEF